jgi:hypothetical protein
MTVSSILLPTDQRANLLRYQNHPDLSPRPSNAQLYVADRIHSSAKP